jgi:hypothetical protein
MRKTILLLSILILWNAFFVYGLTESPTYTISVLNPAGNVEIERGENMEIFATVKEGVNEIQGAQLTAEFAGQNLPLVEKQPGIYSNEYYFPLDATMGPMDITIRASKEVGDVLYLGEKTVRVDIQPASLAINVIQPKNDLYTLDSSIPISFTVSYANGEPITEVNVDGTFEDIELEFSSDEEGVFTASHKIESENYGVKTLIINVSDAFGNSLQNKISITTAQDPWIFIKQNWLYIVIVLIILAAVAYRVAPRIIEKQRKERIKTLQEEKKDLQEKYFEKKSIDPDAYQTQLATVEKQLFKLTAVTAPPLAKVKKKKPKPKPKPKAKPQ